MPLAATVKTHVLRLLRRSKSSRSPSPGQSRPGRQGPAAMVIPNKQTAAVQSPQSPAVIVEPFPMTLGSAAGSAPRSRHSHSAQHAQQQQHGRHSHHAANGASAANGHPAARSRSVSNRKDVRRSASSRRTRVQVTTWSLPGSHRAAAPRGVIGHHRAERAERGWLWPCSGPAVALGKGSGGRRAPGLSLALVWPLESAPA